MARFSTIFIILALAVPVAALGSRSPANEQAGRTYTNVCGRSTAGQPARTLQAQDGIWISATELAQLETKGKAWRKLKRTADGDLGKPRVGGKNSRHDVRTLAVALVYARTGEIAYRSKAADAISSAIDTERKGRTLGLARNLVSYVIAADLIDLGEYDPDMDAEFRAWLKGVRTKVLADGRNLIQTHEQRANNWGTMAGASRAAADIYLGEVRDLACAAKVFKGWLGDRSTYIGFRFNHEASWQARPAKPVGINPVGAVKAGLLIDGALPQEMSRGCKFRLPPCHTNYPWGGLAGAVVQAEILHRAGYDAWNWQDRAILRAVEFLYQLSEQDDFWFKAALSGDDNWQPWLVNFRYGTAFPTKRPTNPGKNMGFTDWTHAGPEEPE